MGTVIAFPSPFCREVDVQRTEDLTCVEIVFTGAPRAVDEAILAQTTLYPPHLFATSVQHRHRLPLGRIRAVVIRRRLPVNPFLAPAAG